MGKVILKLFLETPGEERVKSNKQKKNMKEADYFIRKQSTQPGVQPQGN